MNNTEYYCNISSKRKISILSEIKCLKCQADSVQAPCTEGFLFTAAPQVIYSMSSPSGSSYLPVFQLSLSNKCKKPKNKS